MPLDPGDAPGQTTWTLKAHRDANLPAVRVRPLPAGESSHQAVVMATGFCPGLSHLGRNSEPTAIPDTLPPGDRVAR